MGAHHGFIVECIESLSAISAFKVSSSSPSLRGCIEISSMTMKPALAMELCMLIPTGH